MCGLFFANYRPRSSDLDKVMSALRARGPDANGVSELGSIILGHTRLSIIDVDRRSDQPMVGSDGNSYIIFNGEIFNHKELAQRFHLKLKTSSDTEVVLELFLKVGPDCLRYFNGMFSFAIYNAETKDLFVARDRLGIKPLYVFEQNDKLIISSAVEAIVPLLSEKSVDEVSVRQYAKLRCLYRGHTFFKQIKEFPAGHYRRNGELTRYWNLSDEARDHDTIDFDELSWLIDDSIKIASISDVDFSTLLSGGLDSSLITAVLNPRDTWCVGLTDNNEFEYAELAAHQGLHEHKNIRISKEQFFACVEELLLAYGFPISVPNEVLIYHMAKHIAEKHKVVISGEGADELFFGYDRIFNWAANNTFSIETFDKHYSYSAHNDLEIIDYVLEPHRGNRRCIDIVKSFFQIDHLRGLLTRLDRATMQNSVEGRVPFCDHRLVEYMFNIKFEERVVAGVAKAPLKKYAIGRIPDELIQRKKVGFPVDLALLFDAEEGFGPWVQHNLQRTGFPRLEDIRGDL